MRTTKQAKGVFSEFFAQFCAATRISRVNFAKMAGDRPREPAYEIFSMNVDFSTPGPDSLDSNRPVHVGVNEKYPCKKWLFILCWLV